MKPIKKRLVPLVLCLPVAAAMLSAPPAHAAHGAIVRVTLTSVWATPSPDPMGITYDPRTQRLLISDSEVDEMPGPLERQEPVRREAQGQSRLFPDAQEVHGGT